ncbi:RteC domain-containing protein [Myroides odoratus]|uniref:RteC domain-containing protein n=1 Tax=Myroides odoratus TaxID=256 RepID=UPI0021CD8FF5|nr:RteC domain-containing protein [Myroides odoratus]
MKPNILGKLIYYNKIYRLESSLNRQMHLEKKFFERNLLSLKNKAKNTLENPVFINTT